MTREVSLLAVYRYKLLITSSSTQGHRTRATAFNSVSVQYPIPGHAPEGLKAYYLMVINFQNYSVIWLQATAALFGLQIKRKHAMKRIYGTLHKENLDNQALTTGIGTFGDVFA